MDGENCQIHTVQITGKCIYETFPPSLHDMTMRPHVKYSFHKFTQKCLFHQEKKIPPIPFWGRRHYGLSSYLLPFLKASSLTSVVQTMVFQS